jgi:hypothetical protein
LPDSSVSLHRKPPPSRAPALIALLVTATVFAIAFAFGGNGGGRHKPSGEREDPGARIRQQSGLRDIPRRRTGGDGG